MKYKLIFLSALSFLILIGCSSAEEPAPAIQTANPTAVVEVEPTAVPPTATAEQTVVPTEPPVVEETSAEEEDDFPATSTPIPPEPEPTEVLSPAEVLINSFDAPSQVSGDLLVLVGQVLDANGSPVPDVSVEIWQTDEAGVYDHPDDRTTDSRDLSFQFFGSATADAEGWYAFRTIVPGEYEPRPRHIHFKVKQDGSTLLTSQFYFSDDVADVEDEGMFRAVGDDGDLLLLQLVQGDGTLIANGQIVVDTGIGSGELTFTPSQAEGPFYPVQNIAEFDNDLVVK